MIDYMKLNMPKLKDFFLVVSDAYILFIFGENGEKQVNTKNWKKEDYQKYIPLLLEEKVSYLSGTIDGDLVIWFDDGVKCPF